MQIKFNRLSKPDGKSDQPDMAAQLRAAQQSGVQPRNPQQQMPGMESLNPNQANPQQGNPQQPMAQRPAGVQGNPQQPMAQRSTGVQANPQQPMAQRPTEIQGNPQQPMANTQGQTAAAPQDMNQAKFSEILAAQAQEAGLNPPQPKAAAAEEAPQEEKAPEASENNNEKSEAATAAPKSSRLTLEDVFRGMIGQNIRINTADHESATGRLEAVENGWIKLVNVRSAGSDYYADEDVVSIQHIVKVRTARSIEKEYYNEFMNR